MTHFPRLHEEAVENGSIERFDRGAAAAWARAWLFDHALPLWWRVGADHADGGFFERIDLAGNAVPLAKRVRVQARQSFVYAVAGRIGWSGPWREAVAHGLRHILTTYRRDDGLFMITPDHVASSRETGVDLYDQAFVLLAFAAGWSCGHESDRLRAEAIHLLATLRATAKHPAGGFREFNTADTVLRANPHMHLLEALLTWIQLGVRDPFEEAARELIDLACDRMIHPLTGAIGEHFSNNWDRRAPQDMMCEPGHQFEWAYMLRLSELLLSLDLREPIARLESFGARFGLSEGRVIFSTDGRGAAIDRSSRLWAQTEALRAYAVSTDFASTVASGLGQRFDAVRRMLTEAPIAGLWRERMSDDGKWVDEAAPASSLYHIVTGFAPFLTCHSNLLLTPL